jgi:succinate-acetate transporter protein
MDTWRSLSFNSDLNNKTSVEILEYFKSTNTSAKINFVLAEMQVFTFAYWFKNKKSVSCFFFFFIQDGLFKSIPGKKLNVPSQRLGVLDKG